jgi:Ser/Thr protein kinase RdoA (MazF antagonist)
MSADSQEAVFPMLLPDTVLTLAEQQLNCRCQAICRQLNSYINRVFELVSEDGHGLVIKFYRPDRWSRGGIEEADRFVLELQEQEIPVVAPLPLLDGTTLAEYRDPETDSRVLFSIFPRMGGRFLDEFSHGQWLEIGRLLGRMHQVGATSRAAHRNTVHPLQTTMDQVRFLLNGNFMAPHLEQSFNSVSRELIELITPLFEGMESIRLHGDCHFANMIHRPDESFFLIDFDDMVNGPPVQDVWMLFPSYRQKSLAEIELFLEGYETFRHFDRSSLCLMEPLRAMRYIHYAAWCAQQSRDPGFASQNPEWGSELYWQEEVRDLREQLERIRLDSESPGNSNPMYL